MRNVIWVAAAFLGASCAMEPATSEDIASLELAVLVPGSTSGTDEWNSGKTSHLSSWQSVDCGNINNNSWVTGIRMWREPSSNADNFVAKMDVECTQYQLAYRNGDLFNEPTGTRTASNVFTANHRSTNHRYRLPDASEAFVTALAVFHKSYVNGISAYASAVTHSSDGDVLNDDHAINLNRTGSGFSIGSFPFNVEVLECPAQQALQGISLRYDTRNGKIRRVRMDCRRLTNIL